MESGKAGSEMAMVLKSGLMELNMMEIGKKEKLTVRVLSNMLMATHIKVTGQMIKQTAKERILIQMELHMKDFGRTIFKKERELNDGLMVQSTKEIMLRVKSMALEYIGGAMEVDSQVIG